MAETIESLKKKIIELENQQGFVVAEGELKFIHDVENLTETFSSILVGIDCSGFINGRPFVDYKGFQVTGFTKKEFKNFDQSNPAHLYEPGDKIKIMLEVTARQISSDKKKGNREVVYNNVTIIRSKMIEQGPRGEAKAKPEIKSDETPKQEETTEDAPF